MDLSTPLWCLGHMYTGGVVIHHHPLDQTGWLTTGVKEQHLPTEDEFQPAPTLLTADCQHAHSTQRQHPVYFCALDAHGPVYEVPLVENNREITA